MSVKAIGVLSAESVGFSRPLLFHQMLITDVIKSLTIIWLLC